MAGPRRIVGCEVCVCVGDDPGCGLRVGAEPDCEVCVSGCEVPVPVPGPGFGDCRADDGWSGTGCTAATGRLGPPGPCPTVAASDRPAATTTIAALAAMAVPAGLMRRGLLRHG
jgi:hypothetical protein